MVGYHPRSLRPPSIAHVVSPAVITSSSEVAREIDHGLGGTSSAVFSAHNRPSSFTARYFHLSVLPSYLVLILTTLRFVTLPVQDFLFFATMGETTTETFDVTPGAGQQSYWLDYFSAKNINASISSYTSTPNVLISSATMSKEQIPEFIISKFISNHKSLFDFTYEVGQTYFTNLRIRPEMRLNASTVSVKLLDTIPDTASGFSIYHVSSTGAKTSYIPLSSCTECTLCMLNRTLEDFFYEYLTGSGCSSKACQTALRASLVDLSSFELLRCLNLPTAHAKVEYIISFDERYRAAIKLSQFWAPPPHKVSLGTVTGLNDILFGPDFLASLDVTSNPVSLERMLAAQSWPHAFATTSHLSSGCVWGTNSQEVHVNTSAIFSEADRTSFSEFGKCIKWAVQNPAFLTGLWGGWIKQSSFNVDPVAQEIFTFTADAVDIREFNDTSSPASTGSSSSSTASTVAAEAESSSASTSGSSDDGAGSSQAGRTKGGGRALHVWAIDQTKKDLGIITTLKIIQGQCSTLTAKNDRAYDGVFLYTPGARCEPIKIATYDTHNFPYVDNCLLAGVLYDPVASANNSNSSSQDSVFPHQETVYVSGTEQGVTAEIKARLPGEFMTCVMQGWASGRPITNNIMQVLEWGRSFRISLSANMNSHLNVISSLLYVGIIGSAFLALKAIKMSKDHLWLLAYLRPFGSRHVIDTWDISRRLLQEVGGSTKVMLSIAPLSLLLYCSVARVTGVELTGVIYDDASLWSRILNYRDVQAYRILLAIFSLSYVWVKPVSFARYSSVLHSYLDERISMAFLRTVEIIYCLFAYSAISRWCAHLIEPNLPFEMNLKIWMCFLGVFQPSLISLVQVSRPQHRYRSLYTFELGDLGAAMEKHGIHQVVFTSSKLVIRSQYLSDANCPQPAAACSTGAGTGTGNNQHLPPACTVKSAFLSTKTASGGTVKGAGTARELSVLPEDPKMHTVHFLHPCVIVDFLLSIQPEARKELAKNFFYDVYYQVHRRDERSGRSGDAFEGEEGEEEEDENGHDTNYDDTASLFNSRADSTGSTLSKFIRVKRFSQSQRKYRSAGNKLNTIQPQRGQQPVESAQDTSRNPQSQDNREPTNGAPSSMRDVRLSTKIASSKESGTAHTKVGEKTTKSPLVPPIRPPANTAALTSGPFSQPPAMKWRGTLTMDGYCR